MWQLQALTRPFALQAPDYLDVVKQPMDFGAMQRKVAEHKYKNVAQCEADFRQIVTNTAEYNGPDHEYTVLAKRLLGNVEHLLARARQVEEEQAAEKAMEEELQLEQELEQQAATLQDSDDEEQPIAEQQQQHMVPEVMQVPVPPQASLVAATPTLRPPAAVAGPTGGSAWRSYGRGANYCE